MKNFLPDSLWIFIFSFGFGAVGVAEIPTGTFLKSGEGDYYPIRIELTGGEGCFLQFDRTVYRGKAREEQGKLKLSFQTGWDGQKKMTETLTNKWGFWFDQNWTAWMPRELIARKHESWTPVRIAVRDQNGQKFDRLAYRYRLETGEGGWDPLLVRALQAKGDVVEIVAPASCQITLEVEHPDCIRGYGAEIELDRTKGERSLKAVAERGQLVKGKVVDDVTGKPVKGAIVCPLVFTPPGFSPDYERHQLTGEDGKFELRGVDGMIGVEHSDYVQREFYLDEESDGKGVIFRLERGKKARGIVRDPSGQPVAGVRVSGGGKDSITGGDGAFEMKGLQKRSDQNWSFDFRKEGFNELNLRVQELDPDGLKVELMPLPVFRGQVLLPDGKPAKAYDLVCGPGTSPARFECDEFEVKDENGRFRFQPPSLPEKGDQFWLGVRASGAAVCERVVMMDQLESGDFQIKLEEGHQLIAAIELPEGATWPVKVKLEVADRPDPHEFLVANHAGKNLSSFQGLLAAEEQLVIPHLRSGDFELKLETKGATPVIRECSITNQNLDLGVIELAGTGSISGVVMDPYDLEKPWKFADGEVLIEGFGSRMFGAYLRFKTDENGRFQLDGVPTGEVVVSFPFHLSADIIDAQQKVARVVEGENVEIRFEGRKGAWAQPLKILVGGKEGGGLAESKRKVNTESKRKVNNITDRERFHLRFEVSPMGTGSASWASATEWESDDGLGAVIPDIAAGIWKIRVYDWLGSRGFDEGLRAEVVAEVNDKRSPIEINFGANTLSGRVTSPRETRRIIRVLAVGKKSGRVFLSRCDERGNFVIRYLPADTYIVHAHDDEGGWCELGDHLLEVPLVDCGEHQLKKGGHLKGLVSRKLLGSLDLMDLKVVRADGVEIPVDEVAESGAFHFGHLRPGKWSIVLAREGKEISRKEVEIQQGKTVKLSEPLGL